MRNFLKICNIPHFKNRFVSIKTATFAWHQIDKADLQQSKIYHFPFHAFRRRNIANRNSHRKPNKARNYQCHFIINVDLHFNNLKFTKCCSYIWIIESFRKRISVCSDENCPQAVGVFSKRTLFAWFAWNCSLFATVFLTVRSRTEIIHSEGGPICSDTAKPLNGQDIILRVFAY